MEQFSNGRHSAPYRVWYRYRGLVFVIPLFFLVVFRRWETEASVYTWGAGLAIFACGIGIRMWSQVHLRFRLDKKKLTLTGPYRYTRNPIYIGNTLILLGLCVVSELLWFLPIMLMLCVVIYTRVIRYEEAHLLSKYGQPYAEFLASVPRWIPCRKPRSNGYWADASSEIRRYLGPAIIAELHILLLLLPFILKEWCENWHF